MEKIPEKDENPLDLEITNFKDDTYGIRVTKDNGLSEVLNIIIDGFDNARDKLQEILEQIKSRTLN